MSQPDYDDDLFFQPQQPTIKNFEELVEKLGVKKITIEDEEVLVEGFRVFFDDYYLTLEYRSSGEFLLKGCFVFYCLPQQAYNIITTLKDNLGG